jgi:hypothetical protein
MYAVIRFGPSQSFVFYPEAMEASLNMENWDEADRYANALEDFTKAEPLPWATFFVARTRALAQWGHGQRVQETRAEIQRLYDKAEKASIATALPASVKPLRPPEP